MNSTALTTNITVSTYLYADLSEEAKLTAQKIYAVLSEEFENEGVFEIALEEAKTLLASDENSLFTADGFLLY